MHSCTVSFRCCITLVISNYLTCNQLNVVTEPSKYSGLKHATAISANATAIQFNTEKYTFIVHDTTMYKKIILYLEILLQFTSPNVLLNLQMRGRSRKQQVVRLGSLNYRENLTDTKYVTVTRRNVSYIIMSKYIRLLNDITHTVIDILI